MTDQRHHEPNCPVPGLHYGCTCDPSPTLRDRFAMSALTGMLASPMLTVTANSDEEARRGFAATAYLIADAMMAARGAK